MTKNFECRPVNETEVDVYINDRLEFRVCLINRTSEDNSQFNIAKPGIGGSFNLNYRWCSHFPRLSRTIRAVVTQAVLEAGPSDTEAAIAATMKARQMLMKINRKYMTRIRL